MAEKGVCELCGFADDSYRIDENGTVLKVCKFCHDGYLERMGVSPEADTEQTDVLPDIDLEALKNADIDTEGMTAAELLQLRTELAERAHTRVPTLDEQQLDTLLATTDDDKKVLGAVRQKEMRRKKREFLKGLDESGEDYKASEELLRSGEELQRVVQGLDEEDEEAAAPLIAKIVAPHKESAEQKAPTEQAVAQAQSKESAEQKAPTEQAVAQAQSRESAEQKAPGQAPEPASAQIPVQETQPQSGQKQDGTRPAIPPQTATEMQDMKKKQSEEKSAAVQAPQPEPAPAERQASLPAETSMAVQPYDEGQSMVQSAFSKTVASMHKPSKEVSRMEKKELELRKIHAAANQTIDDERIKITSPEVALYNDRRPKTNLDVAIAEYAGGVKFLDSFRYVLHRVSYAVLLGLIVLALSTVLFIRETWQHGVIMLAGGAGAVLLGFMLLWYLSHCYALDRRALLLRIRQQEILFASMHTDCYRELRTKFTVIKALGWLLNKLTVLLPLIVLVGGNVFAVVMTFVKKYWLYPVISAGATVAAVLVYYIFKFAADWIAYALDRERNQQIQQQTLLDILDNLHKDR